VFFCKAYSGHDIEVFFCKAYSGHDSEVFFCNAYNGHDSEVFFCKAYSGRVIEVFFCKAYCNLKYYGPYSETGDYTGVLVLTLAHLMLTFDIQSLLNP